MTTPDTDWRALFGDDAWDKADNDAWAKAPEHTYRADLRDYRDDFLASLVADGALTIEQRPSEFKQGYTEWDERLVSEWRWVQTRTETTP